MSGASGPEIKPSRSMQQKQKHSHRVGDVFLGDIREPGGNVGRRM